MTERILEDCAIGDFDYPYPNCENSDCGNISPVKLTWRELELGTGGKRYFVRIHLDGRRCEEDWYEASSTV